MKMAASRGHCNYALLQFVYNETRITFFDPKIHLGIRSRLNSNDPFQQDILKISRR